MKTVSLDALETRDLKTGDLNVIIETPSGSRNKFKYDPENDLFRLGKVLPAGAVFPFDFGFLPSTLGEDGDPLDVLVLMDQPAFPGVLVTARLIGAIEAKQTEKTDQKGEKGEKGEMERNDRLVAVATECQDYKSIRELGDLSADLIAQVEHFFVSYNQAAGKQFQPIGRSDAKQAKRLLDAGRERFEKQAKNTK